MAEALEFDPTSEDAANSPLNVMEANSCHVDSHAYPAPSLDVQYAGSVDTEGSLPASRKHQNRTIAMTIACDTAAALRNLQAKIGKIAREGGTLKWTLPNAEVVVFDLHAADTFEPGFDVTYHINGGAYCSVQIALSAKPYGRGTAVTLTSHAATTGAPLVFTETGIKGDMTGVGNLRITNATNIKNSMQWGLQSRTYSSAAGAALFYEAEAGTAVGAALNAGPAGASGGGASKVMRHSSVGTTGAESYRVGTVGTPLAHTGTFKVIARVQADSANAGVPYVSLTWKPYAAADAVTNDYVPIAAISPPTIIKGSWVILNLGTVTIPKVRLGTQGWNASLYAKSTTATDIVHYDWVAFIPVEEGGGVLSSSTLELAATGAIDVSDRDVLISNAGATIWYEPTLYEGTYLRVPPAGLEARTLRVIVVVAGATGGNLLSWLVDAGNMDAISAQLTYVPRYLVVPSP